MHNVSDEINILDRNVVESPDLLGRECISCGRILGFGFFRRDSSYREGFREQCLSCESAPRLSTEEHTYRVREMNFNSEAVKKQRWEHQDDYRDENSRWGKVLHHSEFLPKLKKLVPSLYFRDGNFIGDLAVYQTFGAPQKEFNNRSFKYLCYIPLGYLPEFSQYEFDKVRDIPIREKQRGWRTILLRLIRSGLTTEKEAHKMFGAPHISAATVYQRSLHDFRNNGIQKV